MIRLARRSLLARRLRLALTALSVALGVTLIAGTYVYTDTINGSFENLFGASYADTDVVVAPDTTLSGDNGAPPLPASVLRRVRAVPGVERADGSVFWPGLIARKADGSTLKGRGLNAVNSESAVQSSAVDYVAGSRPRSADEVSILKATADNEGLDTGDTLLLGGATPAKRYVISGIYTFAGVESFGGGIIATFTLPEAQRVAGFGDAVSEIDVRAQDGVPTAVLRGRVAAALRGVTGIQVRTGAQQAQENLTDVGEGIGIFRTGLLAFAGIAVFVGAFLIFNTFSITVAQRSREFALLRVLGAKRRQVLAVVLTEGLTLGVLGAAVGTASGVLVAKGLRWFFKQGGLDLPAAGTVVATRTVLVSLVVGVLVTLLSVVVPALRATRVPPLAAMREGLDRDRPPSHWNTAIGGLLAAVGLGAMAVGLFAGLDTKPALLWLGGGAAATFLGVALLSPRLVRPIAHVVGAPIALRGIPGRLARENATRLPGRTAVTAAALMVGVALVVFASIFTAGIGKTIRDTVEEAFTGQAVIQAESSGPPTPIPAAAARVARATPGVTAVAPIRFGRARIGAETVNVTGVEPRAFGAVYRVEWKAGGAATLSGLRDDQILVSDDYAGQHGVRVGQRLALRTQAEPRTIFTVAGITAKDGGLAGDLTVPLRAMERRFGEREDAFLMLGIAGGEARQQAVRDRVGAVLGQQFPGLKVQSTEQFLDEQVKQVNQAARLVYALLALSVLVSLIGIVNTLVLSVSERIREIGLLRAVGMSRRQVREMIRYEAVITALIGAVLGMILGVVLAVLVTRAIDGFSVAFPVVALLIVLAAAVVAGVLAAVLPARRAARTNVLEALAYE